ncbi:hypothetical protein V6N12_024244 [Hibiscus sabdariffa]|uniref:Uncharacterized protein n=1 Tax=Hibiscus sabdariffa TaxID=183260 RepID=A0ABR2G0H3_9ROSI
MLRMVELVVRLQGRRLSYIRCYVIRAKSDGAGTGLRQANSTDVAEEQVRQVQPDTMQVLSSGGGEVPQVLPHVVSNVAGRHAAVAIFDALNEKRRQHLTKGFLVPSSARKHAGDGYRGGLKVRKGKENRQLTCSVLAGWLPPNFGHSGAGSSKHSEALPPHGVVAPVSSNLMEKGAADLALGLPDDGGGHGNRMPEPKQ